MELRNKTLLWGTWGGVYSIGVSFFPKKKKDKRKKKKKNQPQHSRIPRMDKFSDRALQTTEEIRALWPKMLKKQYNE